MHKPSSKAGATPLYCPSEAKGDTTSCCFISNCLFKHCFWGHTKHQPSSHSSFWQQTLRLPGEHSTYSYLATSIQLCKKVTKTGIPLGIFSLTGNQAEKEEGTETEAWPQPEKKHLEGEVGERAAWRRPSPSSLPRRLKKEGVISPPLEAKSALEHPCSCPQAGLFYACNMVDSTLCLQQIS